MNRIMHTIAAVFACICISAAGAAAGETYCKQLSEAGGEQGLTQKLHSKLDLLSLDELRDTAGTLLLKETEYERFDRMLTYLEKRKRSRDILEPLYAKLLLEITGAPFRIRIFRSLVSIMPERARPFLEAELDWRESDIHRYLLPLYASYGDAASVERIARFLDRDDTAAAAVEAMAAAGHRAAVPVLIKNLHRCSGELQIQTAQALKSITGYEFGTRADVWELWWKKYGTYFRVKRFLKDFRKLHAVKDYAPVDQSLFSFFLESVRDDSLCAWRPYMDADEYIQQIITQPRTWRGAVFILKGTIRDRTEIPEKACTLAHIVLRRYPLCNLFICGSVPSEGEHGIFRAVFYKLRRGPYSDQPLLLFIGRQTDIRDPGSDEISRMIRRFASKDPEVRKRLRKQMAAKGMKAVPYLINAVRNCRDSVVRSTALIMLAEIAPEQSLPLIEECIVSDDILIRACAETALSNIFNNSGKRKHINE